MQCTCSRSRQDKGRSECPASSLTRREALWLRGQHNSSGDVWDDAAKSAGESLFCKLVHTMSVNSGLGQQQSPVGVVSDSGAKHWCHAVNGPSDSDCRSETRHSSLQPVTEPKNKRISRCSVQIRHHFVVLPFLVGMGPAHESSGSKRSVLESDQAV